MALKQMRLGRNKEKRGAARRQAYRFTRAGQAVREERPSVEDSDQQYIDLTYNDQGVITTPATSVSRP